MGGPELNPRMQRSAMVRSSGPWARRSFLAARASRLSMPSGVQGIFPSGGSMTSDVLRLSTTSEFGPNQKRLYGPHAPGDRQGLGSHDARLRIALDAVEGLLLQVGRLFFRPELLPGQVVRSFQRRDGAEVPDPLQVGVPPRRSGRRCRVRRLCSTERGRQRHKRGPGHDRRKTSIAHRILLIARLRFPKTVAVESGGIGCDCVQDPHGPQPIPVDGARTPVPGRRAPCAADPGSKS